MKFHRLAIARSLRSLSRPSHGIGTRRLTEPGAGHCTPPGYEIRFDAKEPGTPLAANGGWPPAWREDLLPPVICAVHERSVHGRRHGHLRALTKYDVGYE